MEVCDIVQETGIKTIPKKKKCKREKWLSEEALQIAVNKREVKSKREKERYIHLNVEFRRIARKYKKAFLSDQCIEIEENNRMEKTGDLFKKIRNIKGTFHAKMDTIKDRNGMELTEAEDIKKRWQEYTENVKSESHSVMFYSLQPMHCTIHGILQARILELEPFPSPGDLPKLGIEPRSPTLQADSLPSEPPGKEIYRKDFCDPDNH